MFNLRDYINVEIEKGVFEDGKFSIPVNITTNDFKIESDINELKAILFTIRKILGKDYALIVTKDKVKLRKQDEQIAIKKTIVAFIALYIKDSFFLHFNCTSYRICAKIRVFLFILFGF